MERSQHAYYQSQLLIRAHLDPTISEQPWDGTNRIIRVQEDHIPLLQAVRITVWQIVLAKG